MPVSMETAQAVNRVAMSRISWRDMGGLMRPGRPNHLSVPEGISCHDVYGMMKMS